MAEIITLRAIALKQRKQGGARVGRNAEIITLRAIALKLQLGAGPNGSAMRRDHNATSYSTETFSRILVNKLFLISRDHNATSYSTETKTIRGNTILTSSRDHNATSYSTETDSSDTRHNALDSRDHNATSYSTETFFLLVVLVLLVAEIITLRAIALKRPADICY